MLAGSVIDAAPVRTAWHVALLLSFLHSYIYTIKILISIIVSISHSAGLQSAWEHYTIVSEASVPIAPKGGGPI